MNASTLELNVPAPSRMGEQEKRHTSAKCASFLLVYMEDKIQNLVCKINAA